MGRTKICQKLVYNGEEKKNRVALKWDAEQDDSERYKSAAPT
jgi:hypothetical protein